MFYAKTGHSGKFKSLFEVLFQNMTSVCFSICKEGLRLQHRTTQNIIIDVFLPAQNFDEYIFDEEEPMYVGLGININKEFFKFVKNKDVITMKICHKTKPFVFEFERRSDNRQEVWEGSIETIQNITPLDHDKYSVNSVKISAADFSQLCSSFTTSTINIVKSCGQIVVSNDTGISKKTSMFGEKNSDDLELFSQICSSEQFSRISKLRSFVNEPIDAFIETGKPIHLKCKSNVGIVNIYIHAC
jgi:hypothetical protein